MKKCITTLFLIVSLVTFSQNSGQANLNWILDSSLKYETFTVDIPQFQSENFEFDLNSKQIFFRLNFDNKGFALENSLVIDNVVYENISIQQVGALNPDLISNSINAKIVNVQAREEISPNIILSPIIKDGNNFKIVKSFSYSFSKGSSNRNVNSVSSRSNSVLANGTWFKFYIQKSGVYSINRNFLRQLGLNPDSFDPRNLKIYGNGGRMVPLANSTYYPNDLTENAIQVFGENDGSFDDGDYAIFYGEGVDNWSNENQTFGNLYEDKSYYYINVDESLGKRIQNSVLPTSLPTVTFTTFDDESFYEKDLINISRLGRKWFGESFATNSTQNFNFNIPNVVVNSQILVKVETAIKNGPTALFKVNANEILVNQTSSSGALFTEKEYNGNILGADNVTVKINLDNRGIPITEGYLDFISLKSKRNLIGYGKQFRFQNNLSASGSGVANYQITNANNISQIWNITDIWNVSKIDNTQSNISFNANLGTLQKYIAIDLNDLYTPAKDSNVRINNQDLKGTIFKDDYGLDEDVDYLIVAPNFLVSNAQKLAAFHKSYSKLNVKVVSLESIYQEFSSGKQDIGAIRNFVKYVYDNASSASKKVKYLNLFGDATYDFKNYGNRTRNNTNIVPIYHSLVCNSIGENGFASDDFFGLMDLTEGNLDPNYSFAPNGIDIAVGRMIVSNTTQADQMINKVIEYHDQKSYGNWRNNYVVIADDPDSFASGDKSLQFNQNKLADEITAEKPFMNLKKILLDGYKQTATAGGDRYPQARQDIFDNFEKGALVFNYLGHGGEDGLSQERIWEKSDGLNVKNRFKYPLFITLTCDFSRFDNPTRATGGEFVYLNPTGGSIAMITTIREIGSITAENFNFILGEKLFSYSSNSYTSIADALRRAKNVSPSSGRVIFFLGDPALKLAIPQQKVVLTKVNDMPITGPIDDFKSLSFMKLSGEIQNEFGVPVNDYEGELAINIYDKTIIRTTLGNDGADAQLLNGLGQTVFGPVMPFKTLGETIFRGNASVKNGKFEFGFVVPRDIRTVTDTGKISFYAKNNQKLLDNTGLDTSIKIGGVNLLAPEDTTPPVVRLFMNDETFVNGGITNESPIFLAFMEDENGINTAAGIGHDIEAVLDGKITSPYILNDYYETELDNYKKGKLKFQFRNLSLGLHTLTFKAWDVYNNLITQELQFIVVGNETLTLTNVLNYPNPFVNYTQFWFTHNRPLEPLEVQVQVLTITGKVVWTKIETITTSGFLSREISWDGKDDFGDRIGKGVYVYKLTVKSTLTDSVTEKYEKLVIL